MPDQGHFALEGWRAAIAPHCKVAARLRGNQFDAASINSAGPINLKRRSLVPEVIQVGTIFLREGTLLPDTLNLDTVSYTSGLRKVKHFDGDQLDRKLQESGWQFFLLAGSIHAAAFGLDEQTTLRKAIKQLQTHPGAAAFNALEITRIVRANSTRFLGVLHITVSACARHAQKEVFLPAPEEFSELEAATVAA